MGLNPGRSIPTFIVYPIRLHIAPKTLSKDDLGYRVTEDHQVQPPGKYSLSSRNLESKGVGVPVFLPRAESDLA